MTTSSATADEQTRPSLRGIHINHNQTVLPARPTLSGIAMNHNQTVLAGGRTAARR